MSIERWTVLLRMAFTITLLVWVWSGSRVALVLVLSLQVLAIEILTAIVIRLDVARRIGPSR